MEAPTGEFIETKFIEENVNKRKHGVSSQWTEGDRGELTPNPMIFASDCNDKMIS